MDHIRVSSKGQITLPGQIRRKLHIRAGDQVAVYLEGEQVILRDIDVFVLFYPFWLNAPPAMLKGYLDRVFGMGFAYGKGRSGNEPLLRGRKLLSFTASGAPTEWVMKTGALEAVRTLLDEHVAAVCGLQVGEHLHFGGIVPGIRGDVVARHQQSVRDLVARQFGPH